MLVTIHQSRQARASVPWDFAWEHIDNNAHDLAEFVQIADGLDKPAVAVSLLEISPKSQFAKAVFIEKDWERARNHIAEWEQDANGSPAILAALAKRYTELGKIEDAQRALPDTSAFPPITGPTSSSPRATRRPATSSAGNPLWRNSWQNRRPRADPRPGSSRARQALHGVETMGQGMALCRGRGELMGTMGDDVRRDCAVARKDWKNAETYAERTSRRYPAQAWPYWYLFCLETGQGDLAAARSFAADYLKSIKDHPDQAAPGPVGYFYWMGGDTKNAMIWFRNAYEKAPGPYTCFNLILLADEIGDSATREEADPGAAHQLSQTSSRGVRDVPDSEQGPQRKQTGRGRSERHRRDSWPGPPGRRAASMLGWSASSSRITASPKTPADI